MNSHIRCFPTSAGSWDIIGVLHLPLLSTKAGSGCQGRPGIELQHAEEKGLSEMLWFAGCHWADVHLVLSIPILSCFENFREREGETTAADSQHTLPQE